MAKKNEISLAVDIPLTQEGIQALSAMAADTQETSPTRRAQSVVMGLVGLAVEGGMMITGAELKKISDSTGIEPTCGADLLPYLAEGSGREEGCLIVKVLVDPAYEPPLQELADLRGNSIHDILRETMEQALDNAWYEQLPQQPEIIHMSKNDRDEIESLLGSKFTTGTDLARLIRKFHADESNLFSESLGSEEQQQITA